MKLSSRRPTLVLGSLATVAVTMFGTTLPATADTAPDGGATTSDGVVMDYAAGTDEVPSNTTTTPAGDDATQYPAGGTVGGPLSGGGNGGATPNCQPPDGLRSYYSISDKSYTYQPTNLASDWVVPSRGAAHLGYSKSATATTTASATATVTAEAGAIFASASTSFAVTVGKSWAKTNSWSYTFDVPKDAAHKYRVHLYKQSVNFTVTKKVFTGCSFKTASGWPQRVTHAPVTNGSNVWRVDKATA